MNLPKHIVVVGCLVRNEQERVLLIRHPRRGWEMPQGKVEEGESLVQALHREVLEETGITVVPGPLAAVFSKLTPPPAVIFNFLARYRGGRLTPSEESPEVGWFDEGELSALVTHPVNAERLRALLGFDGRTQFRAYSTSPYRLHEMDVLS